MIELNIPGRGILILEHLVSDVNGTLALYGQLLDGLARSLRSLRDRLTIHLLTADTHRRQHVIDQLSPTFCVSTSHRNSRLLPPTTGSGLRSGRQTYYALG